MCETRAKKSGLLQLNYAIIIIAGCELHLGPLHRRYLYKPIKATTYYLKNEMTSLFEKISDEDALSLQGIKRNPSSNLVDKLEPRIGSMAILFLRKAPHVDDSLKFLPDLPGEIIVQYREFIIKRNAAYNKAVSFRKCSTSEALKHYSTSLEFNKQAEDLVAPMSQKYNIDSLIDLRFTPPVIYEERCHKLIQICKESVLKMS